MDFMFNGDGNTYVKQDGRWFKALAVFCSDNRISDSNAYMQTNENASVLKVTNCAVVLADYNDLGVKEL